MKWRHASIACALLALLAGCTTPAPRPTPLPPVVHPAQPAAPAAVVQPTAPTPTVKPAPGPWARLRARFAMHDCVKPAVRKARRETRDGHRFEARMKALLPLIVYIEQVAAQAHVAGEFVLLPWVESHFHATPSSRRRSAGMWQIMPITARAMGLAMSRRYDGRLDKIASTRAVMHLLAGYYRTWHDWRLADMAYNTGASRLRRILKAHGMPPATPVIPDLPVGRTTRHHLVKLLAIACVIRQPERFHVQLPTWDPGRRLEVVQLSAPAHLRRVAHVAGLSTAKMRQLNAGYRLGDVTPGTPMQLLLPADAAQALRQAVASGQLRASKALAHVDAPVTYTVVAGDSLWRIARRFHLHISQLRRWNHLKTDVLQPGQVLQLEPPRSRHGTAE